MPYNVNPIASISTTPLPLQRYPYSPHQPHYTNALQRYSYSPSTILHQNSYANTI